MFKKKETKETIRSGINRYTPPKSNTNTVTRSHGSDVIADARTVAKSLFSCDYRWDMVPNLDEETKCSSCHKFLWKTYQYCTLKVLRVEDYNPKVYCGCKEYSDSCAKVFLHQEIDIVNVMLPIFLFIKPEYMQSKSDCFAEYMSTLYFFLKKNCNKNLVSLEALVRVEYVKKIEKQRGCYLSKSDYETLTKNSLLELINEYNRWKDKSLNYSLTSDGSVSSNRSKKGIEISQESILRRKSLQNSVLNSPFSQDHIYRDESRIASEENMHPVRISSHSSRGFDSSRKTERIELSQYAGSKIPLLKNHSSEEHTGVSAENFQAYYSREFTKPSSSQESYFHAPPISHRESVTSNYSIENRYNTTIGERPLSRLEEGRISTEEELLRAPHRSSYESSSSQSGILKEFMKKGLGTPSLTDKTPYTTVGSDAARWTLSGKEENNVQNSLLDESGHEPEISTINERKCNSVSSSSTNPIQDRLEESFDRISAEERPEGQFGDLNVFKKIFRINELDEILKKEEGMNLIREFEYKRREEIIKTADAMNKLLGMKTCFPQNESPENNISNRNEKSIFGKIVRNTRR